MKRNARYTAVAVAVALIALVMAALPAMADPGNGKGAENAGENSKVAEVAAAEALGSESSDHSDGTAGTSGDPTQPQPRSNADDNGTGANVEGPYDSTRDGSPSKNGNGGGNATGKPCAGCVGKADNKNPPGQMPNGSDHNKGYECDENNGIGKTNPAHTGCTEQPPPPCQDDPDTPEDECNPEPPCVDNPNTPDDECNPEEPEGPDDEVLPDRIDKPSEDEVLPDRLDRPGVRAAVLPFTGASVAELTILGFVMMVAGAILLGLRRMRGDQA